jgi:hypothetical protein
MNAVSEADYLVQVADCEARRNKLIERREHLEAHPPLDDETAVIRQGANAPQRG